jgi:hypothetical protein
VRAPNDRENAGIEFVQSFGETRRAKYGQRVGAESYESWGFGNDALGGLVHPQAQGVGIDDMGVQSVFSARGGQI